jgi:hypothetical protein
MDGSAKPAMKADMHRETARKSVPLTRGAAAGAIEHERVQSSGSAPAVKSMGDVACSGSHGAITLLVATHGEPGDLALRRAASGRGSRRWFAIGRSPRTTPAPILARMWLAWLGFAALGEQFASRPLGLQELTTSLRALIVTRSDPGCCGARGRRR